MTYIMASFGQLICSFPTYDIYTITDIGEFLKTVKIWKGIYTKNGKYSVDNREIDDKRVDEIFDAILRNDLTPSTLYISKIYDEKEKQYNLRCWDGQHRWHAMKRIYNEKHKIDISELFTCQVYKKDDYEGIHKKFKNINIPTRDLSHIRPSSSESQSRHEKITVVTKELVDFIKKNFSNLQSTALNPRKPNFNCDKLHAMLYAYIDENKLETINEQFLIQKILAHNLKLKAVYDAKYVSKLRPASMIKAIEHNCYLFMLDDFTTSLEICVNDSYV